MSCHVLSSFSWSMERYKLLEPLQRGAQRGGCGGWGRKVRKEEKKKEIMKTFCVSLFRFCSQINRLTKCDICTALKDEKQKTLDKGLRAYFDQLYKYHSDLQM